MSLLYWLPLNGNLNQCGLSSYKAIGNNITFGANGKFTKSALTAGTTASYIDTKLPNSELGNKDFSISVWVKIPSGGSGFKVILASKTSAAVSMGISIAWNATEKKLLWSNSTDNSAERSELYTSSALDSILCDKWCNIIMVRDNNDAKKGYYIINK